MRYFKKKIILFGGYINVDLWQNFYVLILINILSCNSEITDLPVIPAMLGFIAKTVCEENGTWSLRFKPSCGLGAEISREIEKERGCGMGFGLM